MYDELYERMNMAQSKIRELGWEQRESMDVMYKHARDLWSLMNSELVECRRRGKHTPKYQELEQKLDEHLNMIEQYIVFGTLLK